MPNTNNMTDREAAIDAIHRFVWSLDEPDSELLSSSLTDDAVVDMTSISAAGLPGQRLEGHDAVVSGLMAAIGTALDTTHMVSNFRVTLNGDSATLGCYSLAQHFRKGDGLSTAAGQDYYFMGNRFQCKLVRDREVWRIQEVILLTPLWTHGNNDVMKVWVSALQEA